MPKIDILEHDLTRVTAAIGTDIPYIPGFAGQDVSNYTAEPILCTSVLQFEKFFGTKPAVFTTGSSKPEYEIDNYSVDRSYIMARELLALGMPVYYHAILKPGDAQKFDEANLYEQLIKRFSDESIFNTSNIRDKGAYTIKYITTGGYANYGIKDAAGAVLSKLIADIAAKRGDAVAFIEDVPRAASLDPSSVNSFFNKLKTDTTTLTDENESFAAAFTAWGEYRLSKTYKITDGEGNVKKIETALLPGCYAYLACLAINMKLGPNWLAMAGTTRGLIPNLIKLHVPANQQLNNMVADAYQPTEPDTADGLRALNAITDIKPYGLCVWGNRTLRKITEEQPLAGTSFLNIRNMVSDIKKVAYRVAKTLIYEQNTELLWIKFRAEISPFHDQLVSGAGIADYKLLKLDTRYDGTELGKEEFACAIKIYPIYAVEAFEVTIVITDADVEVQ